MTEPECTCTELQRMTVCHDMRNEAHVVGCPRWGTRKADGCAECTPEGNGPCVENCRERWRTGEDDASRLTRELVNAAVLPCPSGGAHRWNKSRIDIVSFGREEPIRHYAHWTCSACGLLDAVERDCGA